jgi:hypothetical protein
MSFLCPALSQKKNPVWKFGETLMPAGNQTMIPQLPKPKPSHFANYAIQPLLYTTK